MKIVSLASGSKGNCTLLETEQIKLLIDAGISIKEIEIKLEKLNINPQEITAIILTHEHCDHIKGVCAFCKKYNTNVYIREDAWDYFKEKFDKTFNCDLFRPFTKDFDIADVCVKSFEVPHDAHLCLGYSFYCENNKFSIATDLGTVTEEIYENLRGSSLVFLEANHDEKLLINNMNYPAILKKRILSEKGHLSNTNSAKVIEKLCNDGTQQVVLSHLSEQNNSPSLAYNQIKLYLSQKNIIEGKNIFIDVNTQKNIGTVYNLIKK